MSELTLNERQIICGADLLSDWNYEYYSEENCDGVIYCTYHDKRTGLKIVRDVHSDFVYHSYTHIPESLRFRGMYTQLLVQEVRILLFRGYDRIEVLAEKANNDIGYIVAARLGFDGKFNGHNVLDLINQKGLVYWKNNGGTYSGTLSLNVESKSFKEFSSYVSAKGFVVEPCKLSKHERMTLCGYGLIPDWDEKYYTEDIDECGEISIEYYIPNNEEKPDSDFIIRRYISNNKKVRNNSFYLPPSYRGGLGVKLLLKEVEILSRHGFERIGTFASNYGTDIGYLLWPKMGFDGLIICDEDGRNVSECEDANESLPNNLTRMLVSEYIQLFGYQSWVANGCGVSCVFDLQPESYSMTTLHNYAQNKGML